MTLRPFFPERIVFKSHRVRVSEIHELSVEECGNPEGIPVVWCHGGPGGGCSPLHGRMFDPATTRLIMIDQRGAGKSTPFADIRENTTQHLIADMEKIRELLGIESWFVAGRSWGTTLALLYAEAHPDRVRGLWLAAVFLATKEANDWLFQEGASKVYPEHWAVFEAMVPPALRHNMGAAYRDLMFGEDEELGIEAAKIWGIWEAHTCSVLPDPAVVAGLTAPGVLLAMARFECHYLTQGCFIEEGQILREAHRIAHLPVKIIHGRYDMNCLYNNAWNLHKALPKSDLFTPLLGGHIPNDAETVDMQVRAAEALIAGG